jgi:DNA-binding CsgD family transcriptional regulator
LPNSDSTFERRLLATTGSIFLALVAIAAVDVVADLMEGTSAKHVMVEGLMLLIGLVGIVYVARQTVAAQRRARAATQVASSLSRDVESLRGDVERWRAEAGAFVAGLAVAIDRQFERWGLSPAEKEVGLLLLKGLSHKEIASVREVTEATARQQAGAVYRKAGIGGRTELSAFFLEDLLLPKGAQKAG